MKTLRLRPARNARCCAAIRGSSKAASPSGKADSGETVRVEDHEGRFLAWAAYSPLSSIRARAWSFDESERIDAAFFARRIARRGRDARAAADRERRRAPDPRRGRRPAGPDRRSLRRHAVGAVPVGGCRALEGGASPTRCCGDRRGAAVRAQRHLGARARGPAAGDRLAGAASGATEARRSASTTGASRWTSPTGHKTGFYLDQRDNRKLLRRHGAPVRLRARAQLLLLHRRLQRRRAGRRRDRGDGDRLVGAGAARAPSNVALNGFDAARHRGDRCRRQPALRRCSTSGAPLRCDRARSAEARADGGACRARRACLQGHQPPGLDAAAAGRALFTFSCSGGIGADLFHKIVAGAGIDAGVDGFISSAWARRPTIRRPGFPEGEYLKGLVVLKR